MIKTQQVVLSIAKAIFDKHTANIITLHRPARNCSSLGTEVQQGYYPPSPLVVRVLLEIRAIAIR